MLEKMNHVVRDFRQTGQLGPTRPLPANLAEAMASRCQETLDRYTRADDAAGDRLPGKGQVELYHPGGPMSIPGLMTARYGGTELQETQQLYLTGPEPFAYSTRLTQFSPDRITYVEVNGLPEHHQITARAYSLDRLNPAASTVQELSLPV